MYLSTYIVLINERNYDGERGVHAFVDFERSSQSHSISCDIGYNFGAIGVIKTNSMYHKFKKENIFQKSISALHGPILSKALKSYGYEILIYLHN